MAKKTCSVCGSKVEFVDSNNSCNDCFTAAQAVAEKIRTEDRMEQFAREVAVNLNSAKR